MFKNASKIILFYLFLNNSLAKAQINNQIFNQNDTIIPADSQSIRLHFEALQFLRNTEYFDIIEDGQTYFGNLLQLHGTYMPYKNVMIKAGIQTRQDYGNSKFYQVSPVWNISIFKHKWRYNFGQLNGTTNYGLIEPMYNIDNAITHRIENGIQSIYTNGDNTFNNWLVWNEPTYRKATNQEQFTTGVVTNKRLLKTKKLKFIWPFQGTLVHRGGQINETPTPIYSRINLASGIKCYWQINEHSSIRSENYYLYAFDVSPTITQPYKNGNAFWHTLAYKHRYFEAMVQHWNGFEYQSPIGTQIFNNFNFYEIEKYRQLRQMTMLRLMYFRKIKENLRLDLRLEPFYDHQYKFVQYSYSVYLRLNFDRAFKL